MSADDVCDIPRGCDTPRHRLRRWEHTPWVCRCGRAYLSYSYTTFYYTAWNWREWAPRAVTA